MMQRLRAISLKFSIKMDLFAIAVVMIFFVMVRPVEEIKDIEYSAGYLYLAVGSHGVQVIDITTNPGAPREVEVYNTSGIANALSIGEMNDQMMLYVADGQKGIEVYKILDGGKLEYQWSDQTFSQAEDITIHGKFGFIARGKKGFVSVKLDEKPPQSADGKVYFWMLNDVETKIDPAELVEDAGESIEKGEPSRISLGSIHRVVVDGRKAYLVDYEWNLHVLSIESPKEPVHLRSYAMGVPINDLWIDNNLVYIATSGNGLKVLNLDYPEDQATIGSYGGNNDIQSISVYGGFAFISGGSRGIEVLEITNPAQEIIKIGGIDKIKTGEFDLQSIKSNSHKNTPDPIDASIDATKIIRVGSHIYFSDGLKGLRVLQYEQEFDVSNPDVLGGLGEEQGWSEDVVIIKNPQDEDGKEQYAYIVGRRRGLWILDVTEQNSPLDVTPEIDRRGWATSIAARGDYVYVGYAKNGLSIYSVSDPAKPELITHIDMDLRIEDIGIIDDNSIVLAAGKNGVRVIDSSVLSDIHEIGWVDTPGNAVGVFIQADHAYIADGEGGLQVVNISDLEKPTIIGSHEPKFEARAVAVYKYQKDGNPDIKHFAYLANGGGGVVIYDVSNPQNPEIKGSIPTDYFTQDVVIHNKKLFVTDDGKGLSIYDLEEPKSPKLEGELPTPGKGDGVYVDGEKQYAYIADHNRGLRIINVKDPETPTEDGFFDMPTNVTDLVVSDNELAYLADKAGIWAVSLADHKNPIPKDLLKTTSAPNSIALGSILSFQDKSGADKGSDEILELETSRFALFTVPPDVNDPNSKTHQMNLVDITKDSLSPEILASYDKFENVNDVNVRGIYAYVADGFAGVKILVISDTEKIEHVGDFKTHGFATNVDFTGNYMYVTTSNDKLEIANIMDPIDPSRVNPVNSMNDILNNPQGVTLVSDFAYVSDFGNGLYVFDVNRPYDPKLIFQWNTRGQLYDVGAIQYYVFLADGFGGVDVIYTPEAGEFITNSAWYFPMEENTAFDGDEVCEAVAIDVIPHIIEDRDNDKHDDNEYYYLKRQLHHYVYIATKECGLMTLDYQVNMDLSGDGFTTSPGDATFGMVIKSYGKLVLDSLLVIWNKYGDEGIGFDRILSLSWLTFSAKLQALDQRIKDTTWLYIFGVFLFSIGIFYWLALIAHFVLPVHHPKASWRSFTHLCRYFRGFHGPFITAKEGKEEIVALKDEQPGVALVDMSSAIVVEEYPVSRRVPLRAQKRLQKQRIEAGESLFQAKAEGPGIVFLKSYERIRGTADLRRQIRLRLGVKGLTRDRIEVETGVFTLFSLGEAPDVKLVTYVGSENAENLRIIELKDDRVPIPGNPDKVYTVEIVNELLDVLDTEEKFEIHQFVQAYKVGQGVEKSPRRVLRQGQMGPYSFNEKRVFDAIVSKPYDVQEKEIKTWTELPPHVAVGEFRNMLSKEMYDNLFSPRSSIAYPIKEMKREFARRIQYMGVLAYKYVENFDGSQIVEDQIWEENQVIFSPVREFQTPKPLRSRGIKIITANFTELVPTHRDVSTHLTSYWQSEWEKETAIINADLQFQASRLKNLARVEAQSDLVNTLAMILNDTPLSREALALRIFQALETAAAAPEIHRLLPGDAIQMLREIHALLLPSDGMPMMGGMGATSPTLPLSEDSVDEELTDDEE